ncbi:MAG: hypothetical protein ACI83I_002526, partial [Bacteroidia bacterium]
HNCLGKQPQGGALKNVQWTFLANEPGWSVGHNAQRISKSIYVDTAVIERKKMQLPGEISEIKS